MRQIRRAYVAATALLAAAGGVAGYAASVSANHANGTLDGAGVGYAQLEQQGYANVHILTSAFAQQAGQAISAWQQRGQQARQIDLLRVTSDPTQAQVEIMDAGQISSFGAWFTQQCAQVFPAGSPYYATTLTLDTAGIQRGQLVSTGFLNLDPGHPFAHTAVCLNPQQPNDAGTIAHELGHALGLDHVSSGPWADGSHGACSLQPSPNNHYSIMSYNYTFSDWESLWPPDHLPTLEDVNGPWVCNPAYPAGLAYIYAFPTPTPAPPPPPGGGGGPGKVL